MALAIGLMSGTSADGVTAALADFRGRRITVLRCETYPYAPALRRRVLAAPTLSAAELSRLNFELGEAFGRAAKRIGRGRRALVIGSHGQTVWHGPRACPPNTMQIAEPAVIAERAGLPVAADFRTRDMAAGGEGAPLVPAFDEFLFASGPLRCLQNIGGIGNVSVAGRGRLWTAFDTGPGNSLMDEAARLATSGRLQMDRNGRLARRGRPDERLVARLLSDRFFRRPPPKSLDKVSFSAAFLRRHFQRLTLARLPDVLATLNLFTARSIAESYRRFVFPRHKVREVVVSGGGALNPVLMESLSRLLAPVPVDNSERFGLPVMAKEAAAFAWLGLRAWQGRTNNCPQATGARGRRILGKVVPA
ncbi:MAG: anhydro-N-acetylmuramic acid kinase [Elusimicrobia bacterium]|nr:anhydro-N-acetylmuramic acid kinase [Elusimicrobiota bacterium]